MRNPDPRRESLLSVDAGGSLTIRDVDAPGRTEKSNWLSRRRATGARHDGAGSAAKRRGYKPTRALLCVVCGCALVLAFAGHAAAQATGPLLPSLPDSLGGPEQWTSAEGLTSAIQVMLLLTIISVAPAILLMTTSFIRVMVVLGLLRQALGTQQLPPSQVITSISLFITVLIMTPVWKQVYEDGIKPYTQKEIGLEEAFQRSAGPIRRFMGDQIARTDNHDDVYLFLKYMPEEIDPATGELPDYVYYGAAEGEKNVPLRALVPAFMLSELKTAFLIGFRVYLPFVILDIVVASVTISMGMLMLPPVLISLPFKLMLFVLVDGWQLVVGMLLESFQAFT